MSGESAGTRALGNGTAGNRSLTGLLLLALASPLALFLSPKSGGARDAAAAAPATSSSGLPAPSPPDYCIERFAAPFREFGVSPPKPKQVPGAGDVSLDAAATLNPDGGATLHGELVKNEAPPRDWTTTLAELGEQLTTTGVQTVETLVTTIADPIDSGLSYQFDTTLQAVRLGVEHGSSSIPSYFRGRSWLPWDDREARPAKRSDSEDCRTSTPGVVLFRGGAVEAPRLFVLLLVGETPTSGVHVDAMAHALGAARSLTKCPDPDTCTGVLNVVGPTFSGSATSLRLATDVWSERERRASPGAPPPGASVRFFTGTATGSSLKSTLQRPATPEESKPELLFQATTIPERDLTCAYLGFLEHRLGEKVVGDTLPKVAMLEESGTVFGASSASHGTATGPCAVQAGIQIDFPLHVSALRDAYEAIDHNHGSSETTIARHTSLDVSMRGKRRPLDLGAEPSEQTMYAQDLALATGLVKISEEGVRHVGIHATDIFDAIFLARKIRDVAPDVRLAFFEADALLTHQDFRQDLLGSLVLTPYPFLGTTSFSSLLGADTRRHRPFESSIGEGAFNAMLAARGFPARELAEFGFKDPGMDLALLPTWIGAIGRTGIVPLGVRPTADCGGTLYGRRPTPEGDAFCAHPKEGWKAFNILRSAKLVIDPSVVVPRFWHFAIVVAGLLFALDARNRRSTRLMLSAEPMPLTLEGNDRKADLAIGRMKWELYASVRSFLFTLLFAYFTVLEGLAIRVWSTVPVMYGVICAVSLFLTIFAAAETGTSLASFSRDYQAFERAKRPIREAWLKRYPRTLLDRFWVLNGLAQPDRLHETVLTSHGQVARLATIFAFVSSFMGCFLIVETLRAADGWDPTAAAVPRTTLFVIRSLSLSSGLSPVAPALFFMAVAYVWVVGRMGRLKLAHDISLISPPDGVTDLVSTPIRSLLVPKLFDDVKEGPPSGADSAARRALDDGLASVERRVVNAIWRPSTGAGYFSALGVLILLPVFLSVMKPPSTLESEFGTFLLAAGMGICVVLIGATLLQFLEYWSALQLLLRRTMEHRLGPAFAHVEGFVREPVEDQVSRSPHDLLRLASAAQELCELARMVKRWGPECAFEQERTQLQEDATELAKLRTEALRASIRMPPVRGQRHYRRLVAESALGNKLLETARGVSRILERAWAGEFGGNPPDGAFAPLTARDAEHDDALTIVERDFSPGEVAWLRRAQICVATTVAILVNRYVRQFRHFAYTLHGCALFLLLAYASYPFEPHRLLLTFVWVIVASVVAVTLWIFIELDRNTLISHIVASKPGHVTVNGALAIRVFAWAVVPLLGVAAAQYPDLANMLYRVVEPFTRAFR